MKSTSPRSSLPVPLLLPVFGSRPCRSSSPAVRRRLHLVLDNIYPIRPSLFAGSEGRNQSSSVVPTPTPLSTIEAVLTRASFYPSPSPKFPRRLARHPRSTAPTCNFSPRTRFRRVRNKT